MHEIGSATKYARVQELPGQSGLAPGELQGDAPAVNPRGVARRDGGGGARRSAAVPSEFILLPVQRWLTGHMITRQRDPGKSDRLKQQIWAMSNMINEFFSSCPCAMHREKRVLLALMTDGTEVALSIPFGRQIGDSMEVSTCTRVEAWVRVERVSCENRCQYDKVGAKTRTIHQSTVVVRNGGDRRTTKSNIVEAGQSGRQDPVGGFETRSFAVHHGSC